jgi:CheY-like chemotaxis protein
VERSARPTILLVGPDEALAYLLRRYARRLGYRLHVLRSDPTIEEVRALRPAVVWFASLLSLEEHRPRERGLVSEDQPVIVCGAVGDEQQASELGADRCALHPLTWPEFQSAMAAVGLLRGDLSAAPRT